MYRVKRGLIVLAVCVVLSYVDVFHACRTISFLLLHAPKCLQGGYEKAAAKFSKVDLEVDLAGRSYIITGANSGIGKSTALAIAQKGGTVHMVCRNPQRAEEARREIVAKSGNEEVHIHILDMSRIQDVHRFSRNLIQKGESIDVLINNAGMLGKEYILTSEGLELSFATNTMSPFTLTTALLPLLKKSSDPRVIMVSSCGLLTEELMVDDLQYKSTPFDGLTAYQRHKRQQLVIAEELAKTHPRIQFSTVDPGWVNTQLFRSGMPEFYRKTKDWLRTPEQGADTIVWLAASKTASSFRNGLFYMDRTPISPHLPFGFTKETKSERKKLMDELLRISEGLGILPQ